MVPEKALPEIDSPTTGAQAPASDDWVAAVRELFAPLGRLAQKLPDFTPRTAQQEMAVAVAHAIATRAILVAEAGTGTGKTFAYLAPALLSGRRTLVSTGTRTLQDQLFHRDLPRLTAALGVPVKRALLKGRNNYVCWFHLERNLEEGRFLEPETGGWLREIRRFARHSQSGDKSECATVPENALAWSYATSTRDNCVGSECPHFDDCFVFRARREALDAELVVVNHHLFFSDQQIKEEGVAGLLPACDVVIFDEAHQLPDLLPHYYGESVSTFEALRLAHDARVELSTLGGDFRDGVAVVDRFEKTTRDVRLALPLTGTLRGTIADLPQSAPFVAALVTWQAAASAVHQALAAVAERTELLAKLAEKAKRLARALDTWQQAAPTGNGEEVFWFDASAHYLTLNRTPLTATEAVRDLIAASPAAWIFTSATLTVGGRFDHFRHQMGLTRITEKPSTAARWESPFDYRRQALLIVPDAIPEPNAAGHREAVAQVARRLATAANGRTLVLCTALAAMRAVAETLRTQGGTDDAPFVVLTQGDAPKETLLARFTTTPRAVLVASHSFWEGVDVVGEALSVVVIDRLPFAPPNEPLLAAQIARMKRAGSDPFLTIQVPRAATLLQQGAGRLVRSERDHGVLCICDVRLATRGYGKVLWSSLPPFRRSRSLAVAENFLRTLFPEPRETAAPSGVHSDGAP